MKAESNSRSVEAIHASQRAARYASKRPLDPVIDPVLNRLEADQARAEAEELMKPPAALIRGGGEVMAAIGSDEVLTPVQTAFICTLEDRTRSASRRPSSA
jgi:hypothetical protein